MGIIMFNRNNIFLKFISKFLRGKEMLEESDFFRDKFIDYYSIDMKSIEELLFDKLKSDEIYGISLSDYDSQIILSSTGDEKFQDETIANNDIISIISKNIDLMDRSKKFEEFIVSTEDSIYISRYMEWKRDILLYLICDAKKTNIALATNRAKHIAVDIEKILNNVK